MEDRWQTIKQLKEYLDSFDDNDLVFIQPHNELIGYPFYVYKNGNCVYLKFYEDSVLSLPLKYRFESLLIRWRVKIWNLVNYRNKQSNQMQNKQQ